MENRVAPAIAVLLAFLMVGCASPRSVLYDSEISSVERPTDTEERYGEYEVTTRDTTEGTEYIYEDQLIRAAWLQSGPSLMVTMENKTEHSLQVRLEQGAFITPSGSSERILTGDMSYADRNQEVRPITIPSGASASTTLFPEGNVGFNSTVGLTFESFFEPTQVHATQSVEPSDVEEHIGDTFSILVPIEIQGTVNEYTFNFEVTGARVEGNRNNDPQVFGNYPDTKE